MTLPNNLSNPADQAWAKMIVDEQNRVVQSAKYLYPIVNAVKNIDVRAKELINKYNQQDDFDTLKTQEFELPKDPYSGEDFDPDDWEKRYIKFIDKFEQAFFIRQNAENYIANNSHNLSAPYIFVESAYRNSEWQAIREMLVEEAKKNENKFDQTDFAIAISPESKCRQIPGFDSMSAVEKYRLYYIHDKSHLFS